MRMFLLGTLCALSVLGASEPVHETLTQAIAFPNVTVPLFRHGYLVVLHPPGPSDGFSAFAPDGSLAFDKVIELPGGRTPIVSG